MECLDKSYPTHTPMPAINLNIITLLNLRLRTSPADLAARPKCIQNKAKVITKHCVPDTSALISSTFHQSRRNSGLKM